MSHKVYFWLLTLLFLGSCKSTIKIPGDDPIQEMVSHMVFLSSDSMEGRETGTEGEQKAANYLATAFKKMGLKPMGSDGTYFQTFSRNHNPNPHALPTDPGASNVTGRNVIGYIDRGATNTIVIGAHYDHIGYGAESSRSTAGPEIHNGADDNASGVTSLLFLADRLSKSKLRGNNFLIIAFSGEEKGLWGSNFFVSNLPADLPPINYMLNMDMVGRLNAERKLSLSGTGTSPNWNAVIDQANLYQFNIVKSESGMGPSDHSSFYKKDIPVLAFFTGQHEDYHKPSDDIDKINFQGLRDVSNYIYQIIARLDKVGKLPFTKTKDEATAAPRFSVTLGVMPDYLYDAGGMRLDGVRDGKPAIRAGLQKNDIIKKIGNFEIQDVRGYMNVLSQFAAGDKTTVTYVRDGKEYTTELTFD